MLRLALFVFIIGYVFEIPYVDVFMAVWAVAFIPFLIGLTVITAASFLAVFGGLLVSWWNQFTISDEV